MYEPSEELPEQAMAEQDYFKSLSILSSRYGFTAMDVTGKPYPYNILLSFQDADRQLNKTAQRVDVDLKDDNGCWKLMTRQSYETGTRLYYIPVIPLHRMLKNKKHKKAGELLLSVCAYLFHVVDIPYYRDGGFTALSYYYETIADWAYDDLGSFEESELTRIISEINSAAFYGDDMHRKIYNRCNLTALPDRIDKFIPKSAFEQDCLKVAKEAIGLRSDYPERSLFDNVQPPEEDEEENTILACKYISFVSDTEGWLAREIDDMVNSEFQECSYMQQPCIMQVFDDPDQPLKEGLEFEHRLFPLLEDLVTLLTSIP